MSDRRPGVTVSRLIRIGLALLVTGVDVFCLIVAVVLTTQPRGGVDDPGVPSFVVTLLVWSAIAAACFFVAWRMAGRRRR